MKEILTYTDTVLRVALNRMLVDTPTLARLVQVTATLYRKGATVNGEPSNNVILVIFEILNDALRLKARVLSGTLKSMLEVGGLGIWLISYSKPFSDRDVDHNQWGNNTCTISPESFYGAGSTWSILSLQSRLDRCPHR